MRVVVLPKALNCGSKACFDGATCHVGGHAGVILQHDPKSPVATVVLDKACKAGRHVLFLNVGDLDLLPYKIIFTFHETDDGHCASIGCKDDAHFIIYTFIASNKVAMCETHAIEWFNAQYRTLADVADQQRKMYNQIKYSVPYTVPEGLK